jgi:EmrB/QacA subfamily drug resistance transporter
LRNDSQRSTEDGAAGAAPADRPAADARTAVIVPLVVSSAFFMENFDTTVVTTALPEIAVSFGVSPVSASSGVTAYLVSLAVFIPVSGWLADRFGARRVFCVALAIYAVASVACAASMDLGQFVAARTLQGLGGALMVPVGRLIVLRTVERRQFVQAMSFVTTPALVGGVVGAPVGGFFTTYASWRWIFAISIAVGVIGIALALLLVKGDRENRRRPLDWLGFVLGGAAVAAFVFGFDLLARDASQLVLPAMFVAAGVALGIACVWHSRRTAHPLIDLSLVRIPTFASAAGAGSFFNASAAAVLFLLPVLFQVGFGMTALESGLLTFTLALGAFAMKAAAPRILRRWGFRTVLVANGLIAGASTLACIGFNNATPFVLTATVLLAFGFARSLQLAALNAMSYADVPDPQTSAATSLASTLRQAANGLGIAVSAVILQVSLSLRGETLAAIDLAYALAAAGLAAVLSAVLFLRLAADAGANVTHHQHKRRGK